MAFLSGPRQVGKTTLAKTIAPSGSFYFNWDELNDRELILQGSNRLAEIASLKQIHEHKPLLIFDEIHKYNNWKTFLKGLYDGYKDQVNILVTGSAKPDVYKKGGDSLMGRYFHYRLHPLSVAELLERDSPISSEISNPRELPERKYTDLLNWGGFPEPFLKADRRFFNRWSRLREQQLLQEDIRELTRVQELGQLETLAFLIKQQAGQMTSYSKLAKKVRVSINTIKRWLATLEAMYYVFSIRPWTKNITRSLLKEPKYYLWDWSQNTDLGARNENFIASQLLKSVHYWTDIGLGNYELFFLRDKEKRELDFLVSRNNKPWFMVEVKSSLNAKLSTNLEVFQRQLNLEHVFQVAIDGDYVDKDVFSIKRPIIVPAKTFLSQLV